MKLTIADPALPAKMSQERASNAGMCRGLTGRLAYRFSSAEKKNDVTTRRKINASTEFRKRNHRERKTIDTGPCDGEGGPERTGRSGEGDADLLLILDR
jgi:hypothetical protein